jgi:cytidine deaminase
MNTIQSLIWIPSQKTMEHERSWIAKEVDAIGINTLRRLAKEAKGAAGASYSPYSHYPVGAAILTSSGKKESGQNIEIATYSETSHAEEQAMKNAISRGALNKGGALVRAIAVSHREDTAPCGRCRQILAQFGKNPIVIIADNKGKIRAITSLGVLLPYAFTPQNLKRGSKK